MITNNIKKISPEIARKLAEDAVIRDKEHYANPEFKKALEDDFLEAEHCWIFFRNKEIIVLPENWFTKSYAAFAVSKSGTVNQITAFEDDKEQMLAYLQTMSEYFARHGL